MRQRKLQKELVQADYKEMLSTEAGRRVFGGIFYNCGLFRSAAQGDVAGMAYSEGTRDAALWIANEIREIDPRLIGECEIAYEAFLRRFEDDGRDQSDD